MSTPDTDLTEVKMLKVTERAGRIIALLTKNHCYYLIVFYAALVINSAVARFGIQLTIVKDDK